ncbi:MAG: UDP-N-acetylmuramate dehydrogenase [Acidobacteriota bacterium]
MLSDRIAPVEKENPSLGRLFMAAVQKRLRRKVSLRRLSSFRIGGKTDYFFEATSPAELRSCLRFVREHSIPFYLIGAGTNLLFDDAGFRGLILKNAVKGSERTAGESAIDVWVGTPLSDLVDLAAEEGLEGIEFAAGIPGTVGGAVFGNAGAFGRCLGEFLEEALLLDERGREFRAKTDFFEFSYRHSSLKKRHLVVLKAAFRLKRGDKGRIKAKIEENLEQRRSRHPSLRTAYAGSYFKNPVRPDQTKMAAGYLLEKVGAKELSRGRAAVYSGHANFLINRGGARAQDVLGLAGELKARVKKEFGIELEEEVIYLPADASML